MQASYEFIINKCARIADEMMGVIKDNEAFFKHTVPREDAQRLEMRDRIYSNIMRGLARIDEDFFKELDNDQTE